ncbi:hypothetical protein SAMN04489834_2235 [Microterricola viridarii]|uniref:Uncharacterized protein n=1 Tax=Microterricola viridarii TaxID=412690 RepID=A0A1H1VE29_9MICO|nr:hypothetical protein SAMN04489834_2235 [Microterricola viridarii]
MSARNLDCPYAVFSVHTLFASLYEPCSGGGIGVKVALPSDFSRSLKNHELGSGIQHF